MEPLTIAATLTPIAIQYGAKAASYLADKINKDEKKTEIFLSHMAQGTGVTDALKKVFGDEFQNIIEEAKKVKKIQFESKSSGYISLEIDTNLSLDLQNKLLKLELRNNLERLQANDLDEQLNDARMITKEWIRKFVQTRYPDGNIDQSMIKKINSILEILKPEKKTAKDIFKILKPVFGIGSTITLVYTGMLATGAGMGMWYGITTSISGVAGSVTGGLTMVLLLAALTRIPIKDNDKIQIVINALESLIDEKIEDFIDIIKRNHTQSTEEKLLIDLEKKLSFHDISNVEILTIIALLKHAVLIDGHEHEAEKGVLNDYLKNEFLLSDEEIQSLYENSPQIEDIKSVVSELNTLLSSDEKEKFVLTLRRIMVADQKIDPREVALLKEMIANL